MAGKLVYSETGRLRIGGTMKTKELIQYLQEFDPETEMSILAVDPHRRLKFPVGG